MRLLDAMMAVPVILLYLIIVAAIGASALNVVFAIAIVGTPGVARLVREPHPRHSDPGLCPGGRNPWERAPPTSCSWKSSPMPRGPIIIDAMLRVGYAIFAMGTPGVLGPRPAAAVSGLG